jgi:DNA mismatch repair protein MLH3
MMSVHVTYLTSPPPPTDLSLVVTGHLLLMKRWPEEITPLPQRTRSILRSTVILTSLVQVISELIQNSLDANARSIQLGIDCDDWSCWVQDDGTGFTIDSLEFMANCCKTDSMRYSTSKVTDGDHAFGFRGEGELSPHLDHVPPWN